MCETKTAVEALATIPAAEIDAEKLAEAARMVTEAWRGIVRAIEEVAGSYEMEMALRWASMDNRHLYNRYRHTKKKRIRKKYAKQILSWYREEVLPRG